MSLFGGEDDAAAVDSGSAESLPDVSSMDEREKLLAEREVLGFYLSSHPLAEHEEKLATLR